MIIHYVRNNTCKMENLNGWKKNTRKPITDSQLTDPRKTQRQFFLLPSIIFYLSPNVQIVFLQLMLSPQLIEYVTIRTMIPTSIKKGIITIQVFDIGNNIVKYIWRLKLYAATTRAGQQKEKCLKNKHQYFMSSISIKEVITPPWT